MTSFAAKKNDMLRVFFKTHKKAALAFSGGTDSAYLLYAATQYGADIQPYFIKTAFQPQFELDDAVRMAEKLSLSLKIIEADILREADIIANTEKRCYCCKHMIFSLLKEQAAKDGYSLILDGTNASDKAEDRPGMKALAELDIKSPLRDCGITKAEIRRFSKKAGLFTWNKNAYACLATRIPCRTKIDARTLNLIEQAENSLTALGFNDFRVRVAGNAALLQVQEKQIKKVLQKKDKIRQVLPQAFSSILLDLKTR